MAEPDTGAKPEAAAASSDAATDGKPDDAKKGFGSALYKLALAGVGAVVLAQEELETAWKKARPEGAKADGAKAGDKAEKADKVEAEAKGGGWAAHIDGAISKVLRSLSIPTRDEVDELSRKIEALSKAVDERAARR